MKILKKSEKGKNLKGIKLNEDNFDSNYVIYNDSVYQVGNIYHDLVELCVNRTFIINTNIKDISLLKIKRQWLKLDEKQLNYLYIRLKKENIGPLQQLIFINDLRQKYQGVMDYTDIKGCIKTLDKYLNDKKLKLMLLFDVNVNI